MVTKLRAYYANGLLVAHMQQDDREVSFRCLTAVTTIAEIETRLQICKTEINRRVLA